MSAASGLDPAVRIVMRWTPEKEPAATAAR